MYLQQKEAVSFVREYGLLIGGILIFSMPLFIMAFADVYYVLSYLSYENPQVANMGRKAILYFMFGLIVLVGFILNHVRKKK